MWLRVLLLQIVQISIVLILFSGCGLTDGNNGPSKIQGNLEFNADLENETLIIGDEVELNFTSDSQGEFEYHLTLAIEEGDTVHTILEGTQNTESINEQWEVPWVICDNNCELIFEIMKNNKVVYSSSATVNINITDAETIEEANNYFPQQEGNTWYYDRIQLNHHNDKYDTLHAVVELSTIDGEPELIQLNSSLDESYRTFFFDGLQLHYDSYSAVLFNAGLLPNINNQPTHDPKGLRIKKRAYIPFSYAGGDSLFLNFEDLYHRVFVYNKTIRFDGGEHKAKGFNLSNLYERYNYRFIKDIGIYFIQYSASTLEPPINYYLKGAVVNGVVYGDTTTTN